MAVNMESPEVQAASQGKGKKSKKKTQPKPVNPRDLISDAASTTPEAVKDELSKYVPSKEVDDLPSKFVPYPPGSKISYKPYTFGELLNINDSNMTLKEQFGQVLDGITTIGFPRGELTVPDFLFIGLKRKISTLDTTTFEAIFLCRHPKCRKTNQVQLTTAMFNFDYLAAPELPVVLKDFPGLGKCIFDPLRVDEYLELIDLDKDHQAYMLARMCRNQNFLKACDAFFYATGKNARALRQVDSQLFHGLNPIPVTCPECKQQSELKLDGWEAILIPFRGQDESDEGFISFGDEGDS
jgi:hypothetical protein